MNHEDADGYFRRSPNKKKKKKKHIYRNKMSSDMGSVPDPKIFNTAYCIKSIQVSISSIRLTLNEIVTLGNCARK